MNERKAAQQAIEALLKAADEGDEDAFVSNFSEEVRDSRKFDKAVEEFFEKYPEGLSECELESEGVASSSSYDYGHNVLNGYVSWETWLDDEWYTIQMDTITIMNLSQTTESRSTLTSWHTRRMAG